MVQKEIQILKFKMDKSKFRNRSFQHIQIFHEKTIVFYGGLKKQLFDGWACCYRAMDAQPTMCCCG
ncbi:MAG: hypothetical protein A2X01_07265 [Bacteroidetes bacterium GWF2_35_48]|nr:MAG: hypothetical protein A2X01_07265 [Bacteroidetes bacterium GWF2_35_48]